MKYNPLPIKLSYQICITDDEVEYSLGSKEDLLDIASKRQAHPDYKTRSLSIFNEHDNSHGLYIRNIHMTIYQSPEGFIFEKPDLKHRNKMFNNLKDVIGSLPESSYEFQILFEILCYLKKGI